MFFMPDRVKQSVKDSKPIAKEHKPEGRWGVFDHILSQKNEMKKECNAFLLKIGSMLGDSSESAEMTKTFTNQLIETALDREVEALDEFLRSNFKWGGMKLCHACPICLQKLPERPAALNCGHVFCSPCCDKLELETDDDDEAQHLCAICKEKSFGGSIELFF